jgi:hypothetical protein
MKNFKLKTLSSFLFLFVVLVGMLASCKSASIPLPKTTEIVKEITTKEIIRDTIFKIEKDSSYYQAWIKCQNGKPIIQSPKITPGKYLKSPRVIIKDSIIQIDCEAEAQQLVAKWKETYTKEKNQETITNTVLVERQLTWWQTSQIWLGRIFLSLLILIIGTSILRISKII